MNATKEWTDTPEKSDPLAHRNDNLIEDRFWLKFYREGVPATIEDRLDKIPSMIELFKRDTLKFSDRKGFVSIGTEVTYREMYEKAKCFAAWLQSIGIRKGDRVALMMPNCLQYPAALFGTLMAGGVVVNVNPLYTAKELHHQLVDSGAVAIVIMDMFAGTLEEAREDTKIQHILLTGIGDMLGPVKGTAMNLLTRYVQRIVPAFNLPEAVRWKNVMRSAKRLDYTLVDINHEDLAFLQYTGGTTGVAKGAMLTHRNVVANALQGRAWVIDQLERMDTENYTNVTLLPLYHIFSLTANLLMYTGVGGRNILIANPRDTRMAQFILRNENFDGFCGINTLFANFLENEAFCKRDFSNLKVVISGGMATHHDVARHWEDITGVPIVEGYGLTECSPVVCVGMVDLEKPERMRFTGNAGLPLPSTEVRMRREDGSWADIGEAGELCVRGPQVMLGYWQRPIETSKILDENGWLATGDVGVMHPNGEIQIVDRIKDMILVSGFNVYPTEIEDVISKHSGVQEVAVIGVQDPAYGEKVKAIIVPRDSALKEGDIIEHCRKYLTSYKVPRIVEFRSDELPKSNVGKILRRELS